MLFCLLRLYSLDILYDIFIEILDIKVVVDLIFGKVSFCCYKIYLICLMIFKV